MLHLIRIMWQHDGRHLEKIDILNHKNNKFKSVNEIRYLTAESSKNNFSVGTEQYLQFDAPCSELCDARSRWEGDGRTGLGA